MFGFFTAGGISIFGKDWTERDPFNFWGRQNLNPKPYVYIYVLHTYLPILGYNPGLDAKHNPKPVLWI